MSKDYVDTALHNLIKWLKSGGAIAPFAEVVHCEMREKATRSILKLNHF